MITAEPRNCKTAGPQDRKTAGLQDCKTFRQRSHPPQPFDPFDRLRDQI